MTTGTRVLVRLSRVRESGGGDCGGGGGGGGVRDGAHLIYSSSSSVYKKVIVRREASSTGDFVRSFAITVNSMGGFCSSEHLFKLIE